jgi:hypothetical protein
MKSLMDWLPFAFPVFFIGMWLVVSIILSRVSGWASLAERYAASERPTGRPFRGQVSSIGPINENGVTSLIVTPQGLYLYTNPLFGFGRKPLSIPWRAVTYVSERKVLWWRAYKLDLGGITTIRVRERAFREIASYIAVPQSAGRTAR